MAVEDSLHLEAQLVQAIELLRPLATVDRARHLLALLVLRSVEESPLHAIHLPSEVSWRALVSSAGLPDQLNHAFQLLERNNELLTGVFQDIDFNSSKLGSESERNHIARQVMFLVSNCPLDLVRTGAAAEVLLERIAHDKTGGMFVTPAPLAQLMVALAAPTPAMKIADPACGTGNLLVTAVKYIEQKGQATASSLVLAGQERNHAIWQLCRMNLLLHGIPVARIEWGDVLRAPRLVEHSELLVYDRVLADLPMSMGEWAEPTFVDPFKRFRPVLPPRSNADYAFILHCLKTLKEDGRAVLSVPRGVLFRSGDEGVIRRRLLDEDVFEAVVALPSLRHETQAPPTLLVLTRSKEPSRREKIIVVDASMLGTRRRRQHMLSPDDVGMLVRSVDEFKDVPELARVVSVQEALQNEGNLNVSRYVRRSAKSRVPLRQQAAELLELEQERDEAAHAIDALIQTVRKRFTVD